MAGYSHCRCLQASIFLAVLAVAAPVCPTLNQALDVLDEGRYCYYLMQGSTSWQEAEDRCSDQDHGHLMAVTSQSALDSASTLLVEQNMTSAWLGAWKSDTEWTWLTGSSLGAYQPWAPASALAVAGTGGKSPDGCVVVDMKTSVQWIERSCAGHAGFLCQLPLSSPWCDRSPIHLSDICIYVDYGSHNWFVAREVCQSQQGVLATLDDLNNANILRNGMNASIVTAGVKTFWIGLRQEKWTWSTDTEILSSFWKYGEPSRSGNCAILRDIDQVQMTGTYFWASHNCSESLPYLCQIDLTPGKPEPTPPVLLPLADPSEATTLPEDNSSQATAPETTDSNNNTSGGITGGLVFLFILLLVVLGGVIVLFFLYIRRGKTLRARGLAQATEGRTSTNEVPAHKNCATEFINNTFSVSDGTVAVDLEEDELALSKDRKTFNMFSATSQRRQSRPGEWKGKTETCGAHGQDEAFRKPATSGNYNKSGKEREPQVEPKPVKPPRPELPDLNAYERKKAAQQEPGPENGALDTEVEVSKRKKELQPKQTNKSSKSPRSLGVHSILNDALKVARQKSDSTQQLITGSDNEDIPDPMGYPGNRESMRRSRRRNISHQRRHSTSGPVERPSSVVPQRRRSHSRTSEGLGMDEFRSSVRGLTKSRHMRASSMEDLPKAADHVTKPMKRQLPPANLPKPEFKTREREPQIPAIPPLDLRKLSLASSGTGEVVYWDMDNTNLDKYDFEASGAGEDYEV